MKNTLARWGRAAAAAALLVAFPAAIVAALTGCPGIQVGASCTRHADGSVECSIDAHRAGNHDAPVK